MPSSMKAQDKQIKVAIYIRLANYDVDTASREEKALRDYAEEHGYRNVLAYVDNGVNGIGLNRPALNRLNEDISVGEINTVVARDTSRISRSYFEMVNWLESITHKGVSFISVRDGYANDPEHGEGIGFLHDFSVLITRKRRPLRKQ